jgi:hypothetical protein
VIWRTLREPLRAVDTWRDKILIAALAEREPGDGPGVELELHRPPLSWEAVGEAGEAIACVLLP